MIYSGGFKIPEEMLKKRRGHSKEKPVEEVTEKMLEEQKLQIWNDLDMSHPLGQTQGKMMEYAYYYY